jgi:hypothetical protein
MVVELGLLEVEQGLADLVGPVDLQRLVEVEEVEEAIEI